MGIAAFNHKPSVIRDHQVAGRSVELATMDLLNGLAKYPDAGNVSSEVQISLHDSVWWVESRSGTGSSFGFWYTTLHEAVKCWNITVTEYSEGVWKAMPLNFDCNRD